MAGRGEGSGASVGAASASLTSIQDLAPPIGNQVLPMPIPSEPWDSKARLAAALAPAPAAALSQYSPAVQKRIQTRSGAHPNPVVPTFSPTTGCWLQCRQQGHFKRNCTLLRVATPVAPAVNQERKNRPGRKARQQWLR